MEATSAPRPPALRLPKPKRFLAALSDERLVEHVRKGDAGAFEVLYDRYSGGILGFARHMLGSTSDAEDAVQHTFIAAHADIQRAGDRQLHVKAWLYTIARNRCLSLLRARREQVADEPIEIVTDRFADDVQQRADLRALVADINKLPDDQREALVLAEVADLSHDEIGQVLGCEASKVKSIVFQARNALIDRRIARETPCGEIREQIATLRGGALRRSHLRHHIEACPGCSQYRDEVRRQRAMLAVALPVVPSAALRSHVLGSVGIGGGSAAVGAGGAGAGSTIGFGFAQAGVAKIGVAAAVLVGSAGSAAIAENGGVPLLQHNAPAAHTSSSHAPRGSAHTKATAATTGSSVSTAKGATASHRSAAGTKHGFTPTKGQSNGDSARQFATTRGSGKHSGITKAHANQGKPNTTRTHTPARTAPTQHVTKTHTRTVAPKAHTPSKVNAPKTAVPKVQNTPKATPQPAPEPAPQVQQPATTPPPSSTTDGTGTGATGGSILGAGKGAGNKTTR